MARCRTFRIHPETGVPDREITEFLNECEKVSLINVQMHQLPAEGKWDARLVLIVTKNEETIEESGKPPQSIGKVVSTSIAKQN